MTILRFLYQGGIIAFRGNRTYYAWLGFLGFLIVSGIFGYYRQYNQGLIMTSMRDPVSWGFYIGSFTFLVGVAAAAVMLVIPAYIYDWKPIKEVVILGELLAISAVVMCLLFVVVDMGRPDRFWHIVPFIGDLNFPRSLLAWDSIVLNCYLVLNFSIVAHLLYKAYMKREYNKSFVIPMVLFSIPMAVSIHTVTAFLYNGIAARPYWNASILAPRFLCSAFCSGPAVLIILFQILNKTTKIQIKDEAIQKVAELMAYAICINLFLWGAEIFKEYYSATHHLLHTQYLYNGIGEHDSIVIFGWLSVIANIFACLLLLTPRTRNNMVTLNIGCVLVYGGIYIEKGLGLIIPGFTPGTLGEIYEYTPSFTEVQISAGIFSVGFLIYTLAVKVAIPIIVGEFNVDKVPSGYSTG